MNIYVQRFKKDIIFAFLSKEDDSEFITKDFIKYLESKYEIKIYTFGIEPIRCSIILYDISTILTIKFNVAESKIEDEHKIIDYRNPIWDLENQKAYAEKVEDEILDNNFLERRDIMSLFMLVNYS